MKNVVTGAQPKLSLSATPFSFTPFVPKSEPPVDQIAENLKTFKVTEEEEVKNFKTCLIDLKKSLEENKNVISLDLFRKIGDFKISKLDEDMSKMCNLTYVKRTPDLLEQTFKKQNYGKNNKRPQGNNQNNEGGDF